ncbi:DNA-processing protein DprA [Streptomyces sp. NPDC088175]|uniref:DNA-processing protein DprA n=1 Tax=unclassified Streptomyces TaxID=2593676 RepID=UPI00382A08F6
MPSSALPDRAARAALTAHFSPAQLTADLARFSATEVWEQRVHHDPSGRLARYRAEEELASAQLTCRFVIPSDPQWPTALTDLGRTCPPGLWARGHDQLPELASSPVAMTGNCNATAQAAAQARGFATVCAEAGHTVTATLAAGIESIAHRAAAHAGRPTLAVLPCGLDRAHPHTHDELLNAIPARGGAVISLYRPGTAPSGRTLNASAALVAALARAVILAEALDHTTAIRTAEAAIALHRPLLAAPADGSLRSSGNARLLAEGRAVPCPDPSRLRRALALL